MSKVISPISSPSCFLTKEDESAISELLTKETPIDAFMAVCSLIQSFFFMLASFTLILFVPATYSIPICFFLTLLVAYSEYRMNIKSPITYSLIILYPLLSFLLLTDNPYAGYFNMAVFVWLSLIGLVSIIIKNPFSRMYCNGKGDLRMHYIITSIWVASWILSLLAAYILIPDISYLLVPFAIMLLAFFIIGYLSFFDTRILCRRAKEYSVGNYTFRELSYPSKEFDEYVDFYTQHFATDERKKDSEDMKILRDTIYDVDAFKTRHKVIIGTYHNDVLIGSFAVTLPVKGELLPVEQDTDLNLKYLHKLGKIADVGRLAIAKQYRERPDVLRGLMKGILEVSLENDISFFMTEVPLSSSLFHLRLGFSPMFKRSHPYHTITCYPMGTGIILFNNLAASICIHKQKLEALTRMDDILNPLIAERWLKRQILANFFSKRRNQPWMHTIESIRFLIEKGTNIKDTAS